MTDIICKITAKRKTENKQEQNCYVTKFAMHFLFFSQKIFYSVQRATTLGLVCEQRRHEFESQRWRWAKGSFFIAKSVKVSLKGHATLFKHGPKMLPSSRGSCEHVGQTL